jgi:histidinol-phosphate aminotransferase
VKNFHGIVVLDEAYIDFSVEASLIPELKNLPNLVILQTFSKAWGLAGIRLGMAFASPEIISLLNKIKYPYNVNSITQQKALEMTDQEFTKNDWVNEILKGREYLINELNKIPVIQKIYPSNANFLLVKVTDTRNVFNYLTDNKVIVRDRSKMNLCEGCLRFTIGSREENRRLIKVLKDM